MTLSRAHMILKNSVDNGLIELAQARIDRFVARRKELKAQYLEHLQSRSEYYPAGKFRHNKPGNRKGHGEIWLGYDPPKREHFRDKALNN